MPSRLDKTILDYVVIAIMPALIMCLVGSLVFFLLTVFYQGQYEARLHFIFAMFILATVLIARISMEDGTEYAMLFAIPLAIAAGLAMLRFVEIQGPLAMISPLINFTLLGVVWWSAHKLTWDCTLIDEHEDATGEGLLQTIGLGDGLLTGGDGPAAAESPADELAEAGNAEPFVRRLWRRFVDSHRRPHSPGVWVVYFSLAALPIFGLGQRFIPAADVASRQYVFRLLFGYVASGLGLLMTTSFLGLRRYLRQRHVEMPTDMAKTWLVIGSVMIVLLMAFCTLLPRPSAEYAVSQLPIQFDSPDGQRTSRYAMGDDGPRDERQSEKRHDGRGGESSELGTPSESGEPSNTGESAKTGESADFRKPPESEEPSESREGGDLQQDAQQRNLADRDEDGQRSESEQTDSTDGAPVDDPTNSEEPSQTNSRSRDLARHEQSRAGDVNQSDADASDPPQESRPRSSSRSAPTRPPSALSPGQMFTNLGSVISGTLKFLFYATVVAVAAYLLWQHRDRVMLAWSKFLDEMRQLWGRLLGRRTRTLVAPDAEPAQPDSTPRPFSDFANPFATGTATRYSTPELIKYSFEALEAWARERGCPRKLDQTPTEFAQQVARHQNALSADARNLALLYSRAAYAQGSLPASTAQQLRQLWSQLCVGPPAG